MSKMSESAKEFASQLLGHNNHAERPFAIMKALKHLFPSMRLPFLSYLAHTKANGTFRMPEARGKNSRTRNRDTVPYLLSACRIMNIPYAHRS